MFFSKVPHSFQAAPLFRVLLSSLNIGSLSAIRTDQRIYGVVLHGIFCRGLFSGNGSIPDYLNLSYISYVAHQARCSVADENIISLCCYGFVHRCTTVVRIRRYLRRWLRFVHVPKRLGSPVQHTRKKGLRSNAGAGDNIGSIPDPPFTAAVKGSCR